MSTYRYRQCKINSVAKEISSNDASQQKICACKCRVMLKRCLHPLICSLLHALQLVAQVLVAHDPLIMITALLCEPVDMFLDAFMAIAMAIN